MFKSVKRFVSKTISLFIAFTFLASGFVIQSQALTEDALAPYSNVKAVADIIEEHKDDFMTLGVMVGGDDERPNFISRWYTEEAARLANKLATRFQDVLRAGGRTVSVDDAANIFTEQLTVYARKNGINPQGVGFFVDTFRLAFKAAIFGSQATGRPAVEDRRPPDPLAEPGVHGNQANLPEAYRSIMPDKTGPRSSVEWIAPDEATRKLNQLKIGDINKLEELYEERAKGATQEEFLRSFRSELAVMAEILRKTRPNDELSVLADKDQLIMDGETANDGGIYDTQVRRLDILRGISELVLQLSLEKDGVGNIEHLKMIKDIFVKHPDIAKLLIAYFETRFNPVMSSSASSETAGKIRMRLQEKFRDMAARNVLNFEEYRVLQAALDIMVATVKTNYFVPERTNLFFRMTPGALLACDEIGALVRSSPYALIWVHVPYGAYGAHSRYADVARGGLRSMRPERTSLRNQVLAECIALSHTQTFKHMDIPESGSKGAFIQDEGLNAVAAAIGYAEGLINCMMAHESIKPKLAIAENPLDPLELGPDEGTAPLSGIITIRAWMMGLDTWPLIDTGKPQILGGTSHMDNDLLDPPEKGNRVTSQGVMQHAFVLVRWLRETGIISSEEAGPLSLSVTGGLDGDVASGIVERAIDHYGKNVSIRSLVDISGVVFDPEGLDHETLLDMYKCTSQATAFNRAKLHKGGFVVSAVAGPEEENYITLGSDTLSNMNTRALDPDVLKQLGVEAYYKRQAKLNDSQDLITVIERDANMRPTKVKVHSVYLRDAIFFLTRADMLVTGGGVRDSISKDNWPLFFDWDGKPVASSITHGANVFMHRDASVNLEKKGVVIEPDEKANSVGVEISSRMEIDSNSIFKQDERTDEIVRAYFEQVLAKCLENARIKFWALRIEAEDNPGQSVVVSVSPAVSAEVIRLNGLIERSKSIIGDREDNYNKGALEVLTRYFPDVSKIDTKYATTLKRVFERMPAARIRAIASKAIAKEVVLTLGVGAVSKLSKRMGVKEIDIIEKFLKVSSDKKVNQETVKVVNNEEGLKPSEQMAKLRQIRKNVTHDIISEFAVIETAINDVGNLTKTISNHMALRMEGAIDMSSMVVIIKKGLEEGLTGKKDMDGAQGALLHDQYQLMRQNVRGSFGDAGLIEVSDSDELISKTNELIAAGKKVIILDDSTLMVPALSLLIQGKSGEQYCVVSAQANGPDEEFIPFVNINAMAMMGVGMLYDDLVLFESAYKAFTGKEMPESLIADLHNKVLWMVRVLPRITKVTGNEKVIHELKKLFEVSA